jgi:glycosyltransferase involved in cell wall biosynthesis
MIAIYGNINNTSVKWFLTDIDFLKILNACQVFFEEELLEYKNIILTDINKDLIERLIEKNKNILLFIDSSQEEELFTLPIGFLKKMKIFYLNGNLDFTINIPFVSKKYQIEKNEEVYHYITIDNVDTNSIIFLKTDFIPYKNYKFLYSIENKNEYKKFLGGNIQISDDYNKIDRIIIEAVYNKSNINFQNKNNLKIISYEEMLDIIEPYIVKAENEINVVCYKPSYLFKDLCDRFAEKGTIVSDYPLEDMQAYIWLRPQEINKYIEGIKLTSTERKKIKDEYVQNIPDIKVNEEELLSRSIAIHHGTCYKPIVQFDDKLLNKTLFNVKKVFGVCEFEECYGEYYNMANRKNFSFVPIGYDDKLFTINKINKKTKEPKQKINIGFVGRAYGTNNENLLKRSILAHPKGYRKGGDILLNTALRLKQLGIDFKITILGQNWDELTKLFDKYNIPYNYYTREKNITYKEYPKVYSNFDLLFIGARCEGGPVSAIEALSLGIPIVSTDVGIVEYLTKISDKCKTFKFDRKWHTVDYETAVNEIINIYNEKIIYEDRLKIREPVLKFNTDNWVETIIKYAKGLE